MKVQFPDVLRPFLGKCTWRKDPSSKVIYITFDDGPIPEVTPLVLGILDEFQVKATFFCVGENVERYPEIYTDILKRGHKTGNHTFNHLNGSVVNDDDYIKNIFKAAQFIDSKLLRPPHGRISHRQKKRLQSDFEIVMWDVLSEDYDAKLPTEKVMKNITRYSRNGSIVVFHDSLKASQHVLSVLPEAITFWQMKGFEFGTL